MPAGNTTNRTALTHGLNLRKVEKWAGLLEDHVVVKCDKPFCRVKGTALVMMVKTGWHRAIGGFRAACFSYGAKLPVHGALLTLTSAVAPARC